VIVWLDSLGRFGCWWCRKQFTDPREIVPAAAAGKQAIMADAVKAPRQDVQQEPPDELVRGERHGAVAVGAVAAVVLEAERDAPLVECDQPAI